jgi:hypothetical protein
MPTIVRVVFLRGRVEDVAGGLYEYPWTCASVYGMVVWCFVSFVLASTKGYGSLCKHIAYSFFEEKNMKTGKLNDVFIS